MTVNDPAKLALIALAMVCGTVLAVLDKPIGEYVLFLAVGYLVGNGRLAMRKEPPSTALSPTLAPAKAVADVDALREASRRRWADDLRAISGKPDDTDTES